MAERTCNIDGCDGRVRSRGWCQLHYARWHRTGDPLGGGRHYRTPEESFQARTRWDAGCLVWTGWRYSNGYGSISVGGGKEQLVHRWAWEQVNGPIPAGMNIDHRCHNRACANIDHLRLATPKQNREHLRGAYRSNRSSGVRGVSWDKSRGKWMATVGHNGKMKNLGRFDTVEDAAAAAREARLRLFTYNDDDRITSEGP